MRTPCSLFLSLLLAAPSASAMTRPMHGWYGQADGILDMGFAPQLSTSLGQPSSWVEDGSFVAGPGWNLSAGYWFGKYDSSYALGRFTSIGLQTKHAVVRGHLRPSPTLELRRGVDLLAIKTWLSLTGGLEFSQQGTYARVGVGAAIKYRFKPLLGAVLSLDHALVFAPNRIYPRFGLSLGLEWSRPSKRFREDAPSPIK